MEIISVFQQGEKIDLCYTAEGENLSPPLQFKGVSSEAKSLVLIMDDPDAPQQTFVHWVVWDIAPSLKEMSAGAKELDQMKVGKGLNDAGTTDYFGPKPPAGPAHRYFFKLYALDLPSLNLKIGATKAQVEAAMHGHILAQAEVMGTYQQGNS